MGVSPRRSSSLQRAADINDLPAPLDVPNTIRGVDIPSVLIVWAKVDADCVAVVRESQLVVLVTLVTVQGVGGLMG